MLIALFVFLVISVFDHFDTGYLSQLLYLMVYAAIHW